MCPWGCLRPLGHSSGSIFSSEYKAGHCPPKIIQQIRHLADAVDTAFIGTRAYKEPYINSRMRILVVEDNEISPRILVTMFKRSKSGPLRLSGPATVLRPKCDIARLGQITV
jgi:hypothetical protein